jgi:hypothetical protein
VRGQFEESVPAYQGLEGYEHLLLDAKLSDQSLCPLPPGSNGYGRSHSGAPPMRPHPPDRRTLGRARSTHRQPTEISKEQRPLSTELPDIRGVPPWLTKEQ